MAAEADGLVKPIDLVRLVSERGADAARDGLRLARQNGHFDRDVGTAKDRLDLQILEAILSRHDDNLTLDALQACLDQVRADNVPPATQVVYVSFLFGLALDADVGELRMDREVSAAGFDWETAAALGGLSATFDARVSFIKSVAKGGKSGFH